MKIRYTNNLGETLERKVEAGPFVYGGQLWIVIADRVGNLIIIPSYDVVEWYND